MTIARDIQARIAEIKPVYDAIQQMRAEWNALQTVEQANAEYLSLTAKEDKELDDLTRKIQGLEAEKRKLTVARENISERFAPVPNPVLPPPIPRKPSIRPVAHLAVLPDREATLAVRRRLKKMVNRWVNSWQLGSDVQGQINRIADDLNRPLGEAVALLDWSVFEDRTRTRESEAAHLDRLNEWGQALVDYRDHLTGEINTLKTRFRDVLPIWKLWYARLEALQRWETAIAETRAAKQRESQRLQNEASRLEDELADLRAHAITREGEP